MSVASWGFLAGACLAVIVLGTTVAVRRAAAELARLDQRRPEKWGWSPGLGRLLDPMQPLTSALEAVSLVAGAVVGACLGVLFWAMGQWLLVVVLGTIALLVLGGSLVRPVVAVRRHPDRVERWLEKIAVPLVRVLDPVSLLLGGVARRGDDPVLGADPGATGRRGSDEPGSAGAAPGTGGALSAREMIANVTRLAATTVREVMVPRLDVIAVEEAATLPDVLAAIRRGGHSRVPVYRETIDQVVGVLYAKDLLAYVGHGTTAVSWPTLVRPPVVVPGSVRVDELLAEFRRRRVHLAIVTDEYGGTAGIVTIEDVLEEIVGEIQDEYDAEAPLLERLSDGELLADGRLSMAELTTTLGLPMENESFDTVAGLVHHHLGRMPTAGDRLEVGGLRIEVLAVEGHRLRRLRLGTGPGNAPESPTGEGGEGTEGGTA